MSLFLLKLISGKSEMNILSALRRPFSTRLTDNKLSIAMEQQEEIRIILGAGGTKFDRFISTDFQELNICSKASFEIYLRPDTVDIFVAEHVWEHLSPEEGATACVHCFEFLKQGGMLRIAVPDGFHPDADYIAYVRPGGCGAGAEDHKVLYNYRTLSYLLESSGYKIQLLEWFDERGKFHYENWDIESGFIKRSRRFDERNHVNPTAYTSLIIDAIKP